MQKAVKTTAQALAQQKADAERDRQNRQALANRKLAALQSGKSLQQSAAKQPAAKQSPDEIDLFTSQDVVPAKATSVGVPDDRDPRDEYTDRNAPQMFVGRRLKFDTKEGRYVTPDDGEEISLDVSFVAYCDQTYVGYRRFHGKGEQPSYIAGMWYDKFVLPKKEDLPDRDESKWEISSLTGRPEDPW